MRESGTVQWLVVSIVASVLLTLFLNVALRVFPGAGRRAVERLAELGAPEADDDTRTNDRRVRVYVPWKAMLLGSALLTILVNLVLWIT